MDNQLFSKDCFIIGGARKVFWIRAKEIDAWTPTFHDDPHDESSDDESQDDGMEDVADDKEANGLSDIERVSESSFMQVNVLAQENSNNSKIGDVDTQSEDPFNLYEMLNGHHKKASNASKDEPEFPPGFTPINNEGEHIAEESLHAINEQIQSLSSKLKERKINGRVSNQNSTNTCSQKNNIGGSILEVMDELVKVGQTMGYNMEGCVKNIEEIIGSQGDYDGNLNFDYVVGPSVGFSAGIVYVWDSSKFIKDHVSKSDYFVALMGTWSPTSTKLLIISVYAPQELIEKRDSWNYLCSLIDRWEGETVIMGDFNEVHFEHKRFSTLFNRQGANAFNNFISLAGLIDLPLEGYAYTWAHKSASKMSKIDRFLISEGLLTKFPHLSALCLDRHLSDHRLILMRESSFDYGPTPFGFFILGSQWKVFILLWKLFRSLVKETRTRLHERKINIQRKLSDVDKIIDQGKSNEEVVNSRSVLLKELQELSSLDALEISQKAKIPIHGNQGALDSCNTKSRRSPLLDIIQDLHSLKSKGIDFMQFIRKKVGNGENTSFWDENWTGDDIFKNIYPRLYALEENKSISVADKLRHSSLVHTFCRLPRGGVEEVQLDSLRTRMSDVILPNMADRWI
ncbi:RNA-directed DNA polymerase, eukaryota [Tanacetum coccineum]